MYLEIVTKDRMMAEKLESEFLIFVGLYVLQ